MAKMFPLVRKLHLYAAFAIAAFLVMFFVTGTVIIMDETFSRKSTREVSKKLFIGNESEFVVVARLRKQFQILGEERKKIEEKQTVYTYFRPGHRAEIIFPANEDSASINFSDGSFGILMSDFHRLTGFKGLAHILWGVLYDLSCIALFLFGLSGLYLWWKIEKNKLAGGFFFLASTAITVFTIWYLLAVCS
jgi:uncharacterized iron-regulated membrane protein